MRRGTDPRFGSATMDCQDPLGENETILHLQPLGSWVFPAPREFYAIRAEGSYNTSLGFPFLKILLVSVHSCVSL